MENEDKRYVKRQVGIGGWVLIIFWILPLGGLLFYENDLNKQRISSLESQIKQCEVNK